MFRFLQHPWKVSKAPLLAASCRDSYASYCHCSPSKQTYLKSELIVTKMNITYNGLFSNSVNSSRSIAYNTCLR